MTENRPQTAKDEVRARNRGTIIRVGLLFALAVLIASTMQPVFFAGSLSTMLFFAAIGAVLAGLLLRERPTGQRYLTRWDEAAMLLMMSLIAGSFADQEAMQAAYEQMQQQSAAAGGGGRSG